jgi:hypothetical protein
MVHKKYKNKSISSQTGSIWSFIVNPNTGKKINITSKLGKIIIKNYQLEFNSIMYGGSNIDNSKDIQLHSAEVRDDDGCNIDIINDEGTQGIVIDAKSLGLSENKLVKIFKKEEEPEIKWRNRVEIYRKLRDADPEQSRFLTTEVINVADNLECLEKYFGEVQPLATIFNNMDELNDPLTLSRQSYRYLRTSIDILADIGIVHGDLPGNVMLNPLTKLPIIIDFDNSYISSKNDINLQSFDRRAFLNNFNTKR